jgi:hypothetical protein
MKDSEINTVQVPALKPYKESGNCDVGGGTEKEMYLLFLIKVLSKFAFALFAIYNADFLEYLSSITRSKYNSQRADCVLVTEHRLLVAGTSPRRRLMSNIFGADNSCAHQISSGLLTGCRFSFFQLPLSPYLVQQGFRAQTHTVFRLGVSNTRLATSFYEALELILF